MAALGLLLLAAPAGAKDFVYSPVVTQGEKEVEYYVDWGEGSDGVDTVGHELSLEYAFAPRDQIALYGVWSDSGGEKSFEKSTLEWIHQVTEQGAHAWDFGTYVEYQLHDTGTPSTLEVKALLEHTFPRTTLTLNPVLEKDIGPGAPGVEAAYGARWALRHWREVTPAVELYGELGELEDLRDWPETSQLLGPVVDLRLGHHLHWQVGTLFGLTRGSDDVKVKTQVAWEWF
jgi:hypothetical protein